MHPRHRHRPLPPQARPAAQRGQVITEYLLVAGVLAFMLFATFPGADRSVVELLIKAYRDAWSSFSYALSFPL
ncbi:hypothetical protein M2282_003062 [Variovorax boronicumulans]|uniref:hypothetical protein n=1 Tax=Variovorax boronicumulans TaxID=436515 RepID=UPI0024731305|nr:hypothetical protein [Variovorax boronicumulans]MDH6167911.1 hypothetical protein [Variovorax boronicumulans]